MFPLKIELSGYLFVFAVVDTKTRSPIHDLSPCIVDPCFLVNRLARFAYEDTETNIKIRNFYFPYIVIQSDFFRRTIVL